MGEGSTAHNVKSFSIAGRVTYVRERLTEFSEEERKWRAQWLKDQHLSPSEPREVPEMYKMTNNIFRRLWQAPGIRIQKSLQPFLGEGAVIVRSALSVGLWAVITAFTFTYYFKYHANDLEGNHPFYVYFPRAVMDPNDPKFPNYHIKKPHEYMYTNLYASVSTPKN